MSDAGNIFLRAAEMIETHWRPTAGPRTEPVAVPLDAERIAEVTRCLIEIGMRPEDLGLEEWPRR